MTTLEQAWDIFLDRDAADAAADPDAAEMVTVGLQRRAFEAGYEAGSESAIQVVYLVNEGTGVVHRVFRDLLLGTDGPMWSCEGDNLDEAMHVVELPEVTGELIETGSRALCARCFGGPGSAARDVAMGTDYASRG